MLDYLISTGGLRAHFSGAFYGAGPVSNGRAFLLWRSPLHSRRPLPALVRMYVDALQPHSEQMERPER